MENHLQGSPNNASLNLCSPGSSLMFLGTGNAHSNELGNSCALFKQGDCELIIDFGFSAYHAYLDEFGRLPEAIFVTHCHLDHIGGLENLFYKSYFNEQPPIKLFVPHKIVSILHQRMASLEHILAEGNANFWDAFQLIPVGDTFWYKGNKFTVFEGRHHAMGFSFGIALRGVFLYTGDTKPIPEIINHLASQGELIFHDLSLFNQPSHTYIDELTCYTPSVLSRCVFYHLSNHEQVASCRKKGLAVAAAKHVYALGR